jgi:hypothetical protein
MLNDGVGGRFTSVLNQQEPRGSNPRFIQYEFRPETFFVKGRTSVTATCTEFTAYDFWRLYDASEQQVDSSSRPLSVLKDQLATRYGLMISVENRTNPGELIYINLANGLQTSSIVYSNRSKQWALPIPAPGDYSETSPSNWWITSNQTIFGLDNLTSPGPIEVAGALRRILDGSFASYGYLTTYTSRLPTTVSGGAYPRQTSNDISRVSLANIGNVDIVLTPDKSKWTRCVVIQGDSLNTSGVANQNFTFVKSRLSSINIDGVPTGEASPFGTLPSKGICYFPGYAIDLDRGIRLNMAFLESSVLDPVKGNNLKWEPTTSIATFGAKSYMYVFAEKYDQGRTTERIMDSINTAVLPTLRARALGNYWATCSWVGRMYLNPNNPVLSENKVRIRLRVDKAYRSAPDSGGRGGVPTYVFTTKGLEPSINNVAVAKSALDLIRVVPNPYYAYSSYEQSQVDNRVRITNLPTKYKMSIYNLSGSLIRQFNVDFGGQQGINRTTFQDWDLKTQTGLPIASGAYLIHIDAFELGQKTIKWFGIMRPTDLDAIRL